MFERFVFDGDLCDEYGIRCVSFNPASKETYESQKTSLQMEKSVNGNLFHMISQEYSSPITYKIQIVNRDFSPITPTQERALNKWLCRRGKFKLFCIMDKRYTDIWFYANINNPVSIWVNNVNGIEYTVTTNAPFAFSDERDVIVDFNENDSFEQYVDNDEEIPIYPCMVIHVHSPGTLILTNQSANEMEDNIFMVGNCKAGETIIVDGNYPSISSSLPTHAIYNDFNKKWFYWIDGSNVVHSNLPCTIEFKYREYKKVGIA